MKMNCDIQDEIRNAYVDGELDLISEVDLEKHIVACRECTREIKALRDLRDTFADLSLRFAASSELRDNVRSVVLPTTVHVRVQDRVRRNWVRWMPVFATAALALVVVFFFVRSGPSNDDVLANELVSNHVRSMMVSHLSDVISTDQHTVKPWFEGKLDYSPPVTDLVSQGFPLTGGRLDYAAGRPIAALVYQRRLHPVNLFVYPTSDPDARTKMSSRQGFNVVHWTRQGMTFWAVSDLNLDELQQFAQLLGGDS
jgi:anti-sigma factor RsiW